MVLTTSVFIIVVISSTVNTKIGKSTTFVGRYKKVVKFMGIFDKIQYLLKIQDRTQKELTDYLGIEKSVYSTWKNGRSKSYNKYLPEISEFFHTTPAFLTGWTDDPIDYENSDEVKNAPLDVIEHFGGDPKKIYNAVHASDEDNGINSTVRTIAPPIDEKREDVGNEWDTFLKSLKSSFGENVIERNSQDSFIDSERKKKLFGDNIGEKIYYYDYFSIPGSGKTQYNSISNDIMKIYTAYSKLNDIGKKKAVERIEELAEIERYKK